VESGQRADGGNATQSRRHRHPSTAGTIYRQSHPWRWAGGAGMCRSSAATMQAEPQIFQGKLAGNYRVIGGSSPEKWKQTRGDLPTKHWGEYMKCYYCLFNNRNWTFLEFNNWKNPHICWCELLFFLIKKKSYYIYQNSSDSSSLVTRSIWWLKSPPVEKWLAVCIFSLGCVGIRY
jgi:hypothetical protein